MSCSGNTANAKDNEHRELEQLQDLHDRFMKTYHAVINHMRQTLIPAPKKSENDLADRRGHMSSVDCQAHWIPVPFVFVDVLSFIKMIEEKYITNNTLVFLRHTQPSNPMNRLYRLARVTNIKSDDTYNEPVDSNNFRCILQSTGYKGDETFHNALILPTMLLMSNKPSHLFRQNGAVDMTDLIDSNTCDIVTTNKGSRAITPTLVVSGNFKKIAQSFNKRQRDDDDNE